MKHLHIDPTAFTREVDGRQVGVYFMKNKNGLEMAVTNFGAKVVALAIPDREGYFEDIVLGYDQLDEYINTKQRYFGSVIGRYANRIAGARFTLNGNEYKLTSKNNRYQIHGGIKGFNAVVWKVKHHSRQRIVFNYLSRDGEEGYPGNLNVTMVYELNDNNEFKISYEAETDKPTIVNLTHHSFFNLHGAGNGLITDHILMINATQYTPLDSTLIPTGEISELGGTPLDFHEPRILGSRLHADFQQLKYGKGYDHNYVLDRKAGTDDLILAASVLEPKSGRFMEVHTTEPGLQLYSGNFLNDSVIGKGGKIYSYRTAFCLETQHFPDAPNKNNFPSVVLNPGETYKQICIYKFGVR